MCVYPERYRASKQLLSVCVCVCVYIRVLPGRREGRKNDESIQLTAHEKSQKQRAKVRDEGNQREIGRKY